MSIKRKQVLKLMGDYVLLFLLGIFLSVIFFSQAFALNLFYLGLSLLSVYLYYQDAQRMAVSDKRENKDKKPNYLKGLILGIITMIPVIIIALLIYFLTTRYAPELEEWRRNLANSINADVTREGFGNTLRDLLLGAFYIPVFFVVRLFGQTLTGYIVGSLVIPLFSMMGYLAGLYNLELGKKIRQRLGLKPAQPKKPVQRNQI